MWFSILGPLYIDSAGVEVPVQPARQRVILAALLVKATHVVTADALTEFVWDGAAPPGARVTLRTYVSRLRRALGPIAGPRLVTRSSGYLMQAAEEEVDLLLFSSLCRSGAAAVRCGSWQQASSALSQALGLWRDTPLADIPSHLLRREHVPFLEELHRQALEDRFEADLHLGRHHELIADLQHFADIYPLRERLQAMLMLALYRAGRQADALATFQRARRVLIAELAVEPGTQLRDLHQQILAGDTALDLPVAVKTVERIGPDADLGRPAGTAANASPARLGTQPVQPIPDSPRGLPPTVPHFTGRQSELAALNAMLHHASGQPGAPIFLICGAAGAGKTALAVHWAHQIADRYPDGQLYINLGGFGPSTESTQPEDAIRDILDAFAVPPDRIPARADAQVTLCRSLLEGKRVLLVLDNARDADEARVLLAGNQTCTLVTSRSELAGLVAHTGAHVITVEALSETEARELLAKRIGNQRALSEPEALCELAGLCGYLPLALSIVAARASARPGSSLRMLADEFRNMQNRLDVLDAWGGTPTVRAVFSWSYSQLSEQAAILFQLLGLQPGPDISARAVASLAGIPHIQARQLLAELTAAHLINEHVAGRFTIHELLREYAAERARAENGNNNNGPAMRRVLDHYLHTARAADQLLNPARRQLPCPAAASATSPEGFDTHEQALSWFTAEHKVLLAITKWAFDTGFYIYASMLPGTYVSFLDRQGYLGDYAASQRTALAAAQQLGDRASQALAHRDLGGAYGKLRLYHRAHRHLSKAVALYRNLGDLGGEARAQLDLGWLCNIEHRYAQGLRHHQHALELFRACDEPLWQARVLGGLGWCYTLLGDHQRALEVCEQALGFHHELGDQLGEAAAWESLGDARHHLGHYQDAINCFRRGAMLYSELGEHYYHAEALTRLGNARQAAGNLRAAGEAWKQALTILSQQNHPEAEELRAKLDSLGN